jgi:phosphoglycerate dehydrogenase-like enzyme
MGNAKAVRSMDEVLSHSDFVSLHVPLTMATSWMVGARVSWQFLMNCFYSRF